MMKPRFPQAILAIWLLLLCCTSAFAADTPLGAGDTVKISVFGNPDLNLETQVSDAGDITFPLIGNVGVGGLPVADAEKKISALLTQGGFLRKAQVNILVTKVQSQMVSVLGQVLHPGRYVISGQRKVTDMLAMAGGVGPDGGDTVTVIGMRNGQSSKQVINLAQIVHSPEMTPDLELRNGDTVYVDRAPKFYIYGEVQHPGGYRLEADMTVLQALSVGGGLTPRGTERGLRIKRRDASGNLQMIDAKNNTVLKADDIVYVKESLF
ncbi:polysaccharide export protein EpsE [Herbaspirillum lusitanum]|nr:polysaccharide export protein EpsE [Herbaspirillum lusitanum]MCW5299747.1 polysaccharide export protein EpsE [Herbaspirillum lusitanum]